MQWTIGPYYAAVLLLTAAGAVKLVRPASSSVLSARAPRATWRHLEPSAVARAVGACEIALGSAAVIFGARWTVLMVAAAYLVFALVSLRALRRADGADCGCFGGTSVPATPGHVVVNLALAACCALSATASTAPRAALVSAGPAVSAVASAQILLLAGLLYLCLTAAPALAAARRSAEENA